VFSVIYLLFVHNSSTQAAIEYLRFFRTDQRKRRRLIFVDKSLLNVFRGVVRVLCYISVICTQLKYSSSN